MRYPTPAAVGEVERALNSLPGTISTRALMSSTRSVLAKTVADCSRLLRREDHGIGLLAGFGAGAMRGEDGGERDSDEVVLARLEGLSIAEDSVAGSGAENHGLRADEELECERTVAALGSRM